MYFVRGWAEEVRGVTRLREDEEGGLLVDEGTRMGLVKVGHLSLASEARASTMS